MSNSSKHVHYEMIVAKAANMDLVVFIKHNNEIKWEHMRLVGSSFPNLGGTHDYFMCLPKNKKSCLHWLNGGRVEAKLFGEFKDIPNEGDYSWSLNSIFMSDDCKIRIKPKKVKRWIGYCANTNQTFPHPQKSKELAEDYAGRHYGYDMGKWQFVEIEVEV